jgi:ABC-2 type transport system permease protein
MDKKIFVVAKREYLERVRSRWFIAMTLLVPALMAGAFLFPIWMAARSSVSNQLGHIRILDATGTGLGDRIAKAMFADSTLGIVAGDSVAPRVETVTPAELAAKEQAAIAEVEQRDHIAGVLSLTDSAIAGKSAHYAGRNASNISDMDKLRTIVRQSAMMVRLEREGVRSEIVNDLAQSNMKLNADRVTESGKTGSGTAGLFVGIIVGVLLFMSIVFHGQNILRGVLEEKATRVAEVVLSSVKPESLLAGKVLGVGAVGLTQQAAWLGIATYLTNFLAPVVMKSIAAKGGAAAAANAAAASPIAGALGGISLTIVGIALAYFLVGFVFYACLYAAAGSMVNSEQEAQQAATPVMFLLISTWLMVNPVIVNPTSRLAVVLSWLPWSSPIIMPMRIGLTSVSPIEIVGSLVVAVMGCVGAVWLSARIYRVGMLMYGKKPTFAEVAKWIRYA